MAATREDDAERVIRAALAMQKEIADFGLLSADLGSDPTLQTAIGGLKSPIAIRIGINTGLALLGVVGTTGEYTAMGDAVNLASRLEHAAPVGGILISHDTYRHVRGLFDVQPQAPLAVKGKSEPVQVYVVRGAKPRTFRVTTRGVEGIETRTVGREAELQQLKAALYAAREDRQTHLVSIVAEAGTGKSRLVYEFGNWLELLPERTLLFKGRATQEATRLPYALIRDVLASRFEIQDSDRAAVARDKLEQGLLGLIGADSEEASMRTHFIGHLIGFDFSDSPHLQGILGDARQIRDRAFHYMAEFFTRVTRERMGVILLEDMHWADDGSLDLVDHLAHERPDLPLLIIGPTRPTLFVRRPAGGEGPMTYIRQDLRPLSEADSRRLVAEILRKVPEIPPALTDMIVSRAEGNSFYVEELIKMLIEDKVIVTGEDLWRVEMERLAQVRVPATLTGVLQSRLDGLPPLEREKLQQASVVGRVFWENVVERLHNPESEAVEPSAAVSEKLNNLSHKELIFRRDTSAFAEAQEYIFKHAILRDVTYESVLKRLRRIYHAQVAECLIELSGERAGEYAGRIGEHYERAGEWARAAEWYAQAGKQAQETYAPETAIGYYRKALDFWKQESNAQSLPTGLQLEVYRGLGSQLMYQAHYAEAIETYTAMRAAAEAIGDTAAQARAWYGVSEVQSKHGDHHIALENATQAEAVARVAGAQIELTDALWMKGRCLFRLGDAEAALALGEQMLALSTEIQAQRQMAKSLNLLGAVHYIAGRYLLAAASFTQALAICRELGDRGQAESLLNNLGVIAEARGDYRGAFEHYQEALNIAREIGDRDAELVFLSNLGAAGVRLGDYPSAEAYLRQVIRMAGDTGASVLSDSYSYLAETCLGQGKVEEALSAARRALTLGQEAGVQESIAAAWRALGSAAARSPEPVSIVEKAEAPLQHYSAVECFAESLRICTEKGMEGERAKTLRAWARYELEQGDHEKGAAMWQEARETFARLGAELEVERMATLPARSSS
jgi:predicted ATPase